MGGQYVAGVVEAHEAPAHPDEIRVAPESTVETFVALRAWIDIARWKEVPFFLRTANACPTGQRRSRSSCASPANAVRGRRHRAPPRTPPETARPARRGHIAGLQGQRTRPRDGARRRADGLLLRELVQDPVRGSLRTPPARRDDRRSDALPARRRGRRSWESWLPSSTFPARASVRRGDLGPHAAAQLIAPGGAQVEPPSPNRFSWVAWRVRLIRRARRRARYGFTSFRVPRCRVRSRREADVDNLRSGQERAEGGSAPTSKSGKSRSISCSLARRR